MVSFQLPTIVATNTAIILSQTQMAHRYFICSKIFSTEPRVLNQVACVRSLVLVDKNYGEKILKKVISLKNRLNLNKWFVEQN